MLSWPHNKLHFLVMNHLMVFFWATSVHHNAFLHFEDSFLPPIFFRDAKYRGHLFTPIATSIPRGPFTMPIPWDYFFPVPFPCTFLSRCQSCEGHPRCQSREWSYHLGVKLPCDATSVSSLAPINYWCFWGASCLAMPIP